MPKPDGWVDVECPGSMFGWTGHPKGTFKAYTGKLATCPHCGYSGTWSAAATDEERAQQRAKMEARKAEMEGKR